MFRINFVLSTVLFILLSSGCASSPPGLVSETGAGREAAEEEIDSLFFELQGRVLEALGRIEGKGGDGDLAAEIRSILEIAEETYLKGKTSLAVSLLKEAELLSR